MNTAPSLHDIQSWLKWIVTDPRGVGEALENPRPNADEYKERYTEPTKSYFAWIDSNGIPAPKRLDVYAEGYFLRILECLSKDFPKTKQAIGENLFTKIVAQYLKASPSRFTSIDEVGIYFSEFVARSKDIFPFEWVSDLACLEWRQIEAFYAIEPDVIPDWHKRIESADSSGLQFETHSSVRLLKSKWQIPQIIEALETNTIGEARVDFCSPSFLVVYRNDDFYCWDELSEPIFEVLRKIESGLCLDEATEHLDEEYAADLSQCFARWVERGVLCGLREVRR